MYDPKKQEFDKDSLQTPEYCINWLDSLYKFDVDLAASKKHHWFEYYYTKEDSALDADHWWKKGRVGFCNPPYSNISPWVTKAIEQTQYGFTTVMLIPTPNGETYYQDILDNCTLLVQIIGRINFVRPDTGALYKGNTRGSCVVEFRKKYFDHGHHQVSVNRDEIYKNFRSKKEAINRILRTKGSMTLQKLKGN